MALSRFPRYRRRVFRRANLSALPSSTHQAFITRRRHTVRGLPPPVGLLDPTSVAARWWRSGTFCSDPVREYLAPIRLLAPHRPEFRLRLYPHLPWLASGWALRSRLLALSSASVALFYSSHILPSDDTRSP